VTLAAAHGEDVTVRAMRDHLLAQVDRWATRAVDDAANRRRAERFLAWAERPDQLEAAQRRGMFAGMDTEEVRRLADDRVRRPVTPELAVELWEQVESWKALVDGRLGDRALDTWRTAAAGAGR
jgi:hypothetical protein